MMTALVAAQRPLATVVIGGIGSSTLHALPVLAELNMLFEEDFEVLDEE